MTKHPNDPPIHALHDLVDGELSDVEAREVSGQLEASESGRAAFDALVETVTELGGLPVEAEVEADLWGAIEARIRATGTPVVPLHPIGEAPERGREGDAPRATVIAYDGSSQPLRRRNSALWAAGIALALFSGSVGWWLSPGDATGGESGIVPGVEDAVFASDRGMSGLGGRASMADAIDRLEAMLEARVDELAPETRAVILENLETIDAAIREAETALANDLANATLHRMIAGHETARLRLLERAVSGFAGA